MRRAHHGQGWGVARREYQSENRGGSVRRAHDDQGGWSCEVGNISGEDRSGTTAGGHGLSVRCGSNAAAGLRDSANQPRAGAA